MTYSISGISYLITRNSIFSEWTEIVLSLQGVWIFVLFVLKRRVFQLFQQKFVVFFFFSRLNVIFEWNFIFINSLDGMAQRMQVLLSGALRLIQEFKQNRYELLCTCWSSIMLIYSSCEIYNVKYSNSPLSWIEFDMYWLMYMEILCIRKCTQKSRKAECEYQKNYYRLIYHMM